MSPSVGHRSPMRRLPSDRSNSPARSRRRSPSRRERSPVRHRTPSKARSPARPSSRARSPPREREREKDKALSRTRSPKRPRSISPPSASPSPRTKHPRRAQLEKEVDKVGSPVSDSPSPRTKRLRRAQSEREVDKGNDRERGRNSNKESDKDRRNRETSLDRSDRRSARDKKDGGVSRSRHKQSTSPVDRGRSNKHSSQSPSRDRGRSNRHTSHSPSRDRNHSNRHSSRSPSRVSRGSAHDEAANRRGDEQRDDDDSIARMKAAEESLEEKQKQKPSFELSGKLAAETNRVKGVTLLFTEPSDARKPDIRWRLYVFKAGEVLNEPLYIHRQSCYLFGRERRVADIPTDHPSCSKQHAIIQFRQVEVEKPDGMLKKEVRPYLMDLGSTNGTFLNDNRIDPQRYYELFEKDTIKFGNSSREYVILHENSA